MHIPESFLLERKASVSPKKLRFLASLENKMDIKTWNKIKEELKNAHPLARIRKLHPIINNPKISKKIRDEAKELAAKARLELDSEQFWKWGGGSVLPTQRPRLEEEVREERPTKALEETVEAAAPTIKKPEEEIKGKYTSAPGEEYTGQGYFSKTAYERETKPAEVAQTPAEELMATRSEKLSGEISKYHRKKRE